MPESEEMQRMLIVKFADNLEELAKRRDQLHEYCEKVKELDYHDIYERKDLHTADVLTKFFVYFYENIASFFRVITRFEEFVVHWTQTDGFFFYDMRELKLLDDLDTWEAIKKVKDSIQGRFCIFDYPKLYEDIFKYYPILADTSERVEKYILANFKERMDQYQKEDAEKEETEKEKEEK